MSEQLNQARHLTFSTLVFALGVGLDQWTKHWAFTHLRDQEARVLIPSWFELDFAFNPGSAFGMFAHEPNARAVFIVTTVLALAYMAALVWRLPQGTNSRRAAYGGGLALSLMAAGALGNLIDRLWRVDEIRVRVGDELPFELLIEQPVALAEALLRGRNYIQVPRHGVVDFIVVYYWPEQRWPSFNVADMCLVVGVGLLLLHLARRPRARVEDRPR